MAASVVSDSSTRSTCVAWTYGKLMGPQTNVMNGMFGLGSIFAPVLAEALALLGAEAVCGCAARATQDDARRKAGRKICT